MKLKNEATIQNSSHEKLRKSVLQEPDKVRILKSLHFKPMIYLKSKALPFSETA